MRQGNESAAGIGDYQPRAARSSAISGLTRPFCLIKSSAFAPRTSLGKADGPRPRAITTGKSSGIRLAHTELLAKEKEIPFFYKPGRPHAALAPAKPRSPTGALRLCGVRRLGRRRVAEPLGRSAAAQPIRREVAAYGTHILRCRHGKTHVWYQNSRRTPSLIFSFGANDLLHPPTNFSERKN